MIVTNSFNLNMLPVKWFVVPLESVA